jgi:methyltransferase (TIGR00027 family)
MAKEAAKTGVNPIALIAIEQYFPKNQRIVEDRLAYHMLPLRSRIFVRLLRPSWIRNQIIRGSEKILPGDWGGLLCRKRYIDDKVIESSKQIDAVVNLGAGFDTRAYRLSVLSNLPVWEVDQPENINQKRIRLRKALGVIPSNVRLVPIDLDNEDLGEVLLSHDYSHGEKTFFIWEAVTQYLTESGIRKTFNFLSKATPDSRIAFTYVRKEFLEGRNKFDNERFYNDFVTKKIFIFGKEPEEWPDFLRDYGWEVCEDCGFDELAKRYIEPTGRKLTATPIERMVFAKKL